MIIELFGAPGAGKTTFARALTARLRARGHFAQLRLSYRPTEDELDLDRDRAVLVRRLSRPVVEMLTIARHPISNSENVKTALHLVRLLPPTNFFRSIKTGQYLSRLSHSWYEASRVAHVTLFDQAFVQAVCSLALLSGVANETLIADALGYAPKSDLLIRLDAPLELLAARLNDRRHLQSEFEQRFEPDLKRSLASVPMIDRLHDLLLRSGRSVLRASSLDPHSLNESVNTIEEEVTSILQKKELGGALK